MVEDIERVSHSTGHLTHSTSLTGYSRTQSMTMVSSSPLGVRDGVLGARLDGVYGAEDLDATEGDRDIEDRGGVFGSVLIENRGEVLGSALIGTLGEKTLPVRTSFVRVFTSTPCNMYICRRKLCTMVLILADRTQFPPINSCHLSHR